MPNESQVEFWNGPAGEHWVAEQDRYDRLSRRFGERLVEAAAPAPGERVLDVGCGNGAVSLACAERVGPDGEVVGLDISEPMLATARGRAEAAGVTNARFEQGDAQVHPLEPGTFDLVLSRFGVMFFDDPVAAFANLGRALKDDARLAFVCWQDLLQNEWLTVPLGAALQHVPMPDLGEPGAPGPFSLADPERLTEVLTAAGLAPPRIDPLEEPMEAGDDVDEVVRFFQGTEMANILMADADEATVAKAWDAVTEAVAQRRGPDGVVFQGRVWLVTTRRA